MEEMRGRLTAIKNNVEVFSIIILKNYKITVMRKFIVDELIFDKKTPIFTRIYAFFKFSNF